MAITSDGVKRQRTTARGEEALDEMGFSGDVRRDSQPVVLAAHDAQQKPCVRQSVLPEENLCDQDLFSHNRSHHRRQQQRPPQLQLQRQQPFQRPSQQLQQQQRQYDRHYHQQQQQQHNHRQRQHEYLQQQQRQRTQKSVAGTEEKREKTTTSPRDSVPAEGRQAGGSWLTTRMVFRCLDARPHQLRRALTLLCLSVTLVTAVAAPAEAEPHHRQHHQHQQQQLLPNARKAAAKHGLDPDQFLQHYGYLPLDHNLWRHHRLSRRVAVSLYQAANGLNVTGKVNKETWQLMQKPRCGNPDVGAGLLPPLTSLTGSHTRVRREVKKAVQVGTYDYKWLPKTISWKPTRFHPKMSVYTQWRTLKDAFNQWSEPSKLTVRYDPINPDIRVSFWSREHGDGDGNAFDGKGQLLAHAFPPGDEDLSGDIHFDADERWAVSNISDESKDLRLISLHEIGHAVGLSHSLSRSDIMYPVYSNTFNDDPKLSKNDVRRMQRMYGRNPAYAWSPPKASRKSKAIRRTRVTPRWCRMYFNDVIRGPYRQGYIFSKQYVYRFNDKGLEEGYPMHVRQEFPGAPINPLAVTHAREGTKTFFFKDSRYWRFTNYTLDHGYPRPLHTSFPEKPLAALNIMDRKGRSSIYIFGSKMFWQWSIFTEDVSSRFLSISQYWRGLPSRVDAAIHWSDNYIYFFRHKKYYKMHKDTHRLHPGYPKIKGPAWLGGPCGYEPK